MTRTMQRVVQLVLELVQVDERTAVLQVERIGGVRRGGADVRVVAGRGGPERGAPAHRRYHRVPAAVHELQGEIAAVRLENQI